MRNSTGNADMKYTRTKIDKTEGKYWNGLRQRRKVTQQLKQKIQREEINQKALAKEGRLKRYWDRIKQYRQKRTFEKIYLQLGEECTKTNQQPNDKETKLFWSKIWERREHNRKSWMDKQHGERVRITRRSPEGKNAPRLTQSNTQKSTKSEIVEPWWHARILI